MMVFTATDQFIFLNTWQEQDSERYMKDRNKIKLNSAQQSPYKADSNSAG
jgi:hypothetical protein